MDRIALRQQLRHTLGIRRLVLFAHVLLFSLFCSVAQASTDAGHGLFLSTGIGPILEVQDGQGENGPLKNTGTSLHVAAGVLFPGGSFYQLEIGIRGEVIQDPTTSDPGSGSRSLRSSVASPRLHHAISFFGGARVSLLSRDQFYGIVPVIRGGLHLSHLRAEDDRLGIGPHLSCGLSRELFFGTSILVSADAHAHIAPLTLSVSVSVSLLAQSF